MTQENPRILVADHRGGALAERLGFLATRPYEVRASASLRVKRPVSPCAVIARTGTVAASTPGSSLPGPHRAQVKRAAPGVKRARHAVGAPEPAFLVQLRVPCARIEASITSGRSHAASPHRIHHRLRPPPISRRLAISRRLPVSRAQKLSLHLRGRARAHHRPLRWRSLALAWRRCRRRSRRVSGRGTT